jgi:hypothetical protein
MVHSLDTAETDKKDFLRVARKAKESTYLVV